MASPFMCCTTPASWLYASSTRKLLSSKPGVFAESEEGVCAETFTVTSANREKRERRIIAPSGEDQFEAGDDENGRQQLTKYRNGEPPASKFSAHPSADYHGKPPYRQRGRKMRDARDVAEQSGNGIHENERGGHGGCRPWFGPPLHQD